MAKAKAAPKAKAEPVAGAEPEITHGDTRGGMVKMRFADKRREAKVRGVSCAGGTYQRRSDGTYLVKAEHVRTLMGLGLEQA